jgi:hypothetical protein
MYVNDPQAAAGEGGSPERVAVSKRKVSSGEASTG